MDKLLPTGKLSIICLLVSKRTNIDCVIVIMCVYLKSQVVSLQTAHSWANAGVLLGDACIGSGVAFEAIQTIGMKLVREKLKLINLIVNHAQYDGV